MVETETALEAARAAAARGAWAEARERLVGVDPDALEPDDLNLLADAAWWTLHLDESIGLRQRAYSGYVDGGDNRLAAHCAWFLSADYQFKGDAAIGASWFARAERHLENEPECLEHAHVAVAHADIACADGDYAAAVSLAERALEIARREASEELAVMATQTLGRIRLAEGSVREGLELLDDAMCSVLAGRLSPLYTGWIFCLVLDACIAIADLKRAGEWTAAAVAWCDTQPMPTPFHGTCRVHRVEVTTLLGRWTEAESDGTRACDELAALEPAMAGSAHYAVGEIRRRRGDFVGAERAFRRANALGHDPQPGLALLRLSQGRPHDAAAALRRPLAAGTGRPLDRACLLAAQIVILLVSGDLPAARAATEELDRLNETTGAAALEAIAAMARAEVRLAEDDFEDAIRAAGHAWTLWQELRLPHEAAQARLLLGRASRRAGDEERARLELEAAHAAFERLGATLDAQRTARLLGVPRDRPAGLTAREIEVLRLVASGMRNREIAAALHVSEHTVARHLQNMFMKLRVSSRAAATAFAFEHQLV